MLLQRHQQQKLLQWHLVITFVVDAFVVGVVFEAVVLLVTVE
jgi:hypothetical protein